MKQFLASLLLAALFLAGGCGDDSEVFYSISYPIVQIGADVILESEPEEPSTGEDSGSDGSQDGSSEEDTAGNDASDGAVTGSEGSDGSDSSSGSDGSDGSEGSDGEDGEEPAVDPLIAQIQAEVAAEAPVQPGGYYTLDFTAYNCGPLTVDTATDSGATQGAFIKEPGASQITILYLNQVYEYTISSYTDTEGLRKVMLTLDLTEEFQKRYPEAAITKVVRNEYTSTPTY